MSLIEQIRRGRIWSFSGGIYPPENKTQSTQTNIGQASLAEIFTLPIKQHIGLSGHLSVNIGDKVLKGQRLTDFTSNSMLPVHAPTSGTIIAIEPRVASHPSGLTEMCIVIQSDGEDKWIKKTTYANFQDYTPESLIEIIHQAGIAGLGGAGFPTAQKIQSGIAKTEILIINAAECEPYITADDMLIREHAEDIEKGIQILKHILKPKLVIVAVEDNKPQAIKALEAATINHNLVIRVIPTKYPSGGEKQLIKLLTNKEVPQKGIPADIGILVQNIGSIHSIKKAIIDGEPLIERVVTLTGNAFAQPQNVWVRLGTPVKELLNEFNYKADKKTPRVIMGGPMMGFTLPSTDVPVTKATNCILAPTNQELAPSKEAVSCIRCGQCAEVCPASLLPQQLFWYSKDKDHKKCEELNLASCIECGACAYVCPSDIPLVQYYRQTKAEIRINKEELEASERAKQRYEERKLRLERDKEERENRFKQATIERQKNRNESGDKDAVAAALARIKAKKAASEQETTVKPAVAVAIAKAKQAEALKTAEELPNNSEVAKLPEQRKQQVIEQPTEKETKEHEPSSTNQEIVSVIITCAKVKKTTQTKTMHISSKIEHKEEKEIQNQDDTKQTTSSDKNIMTTETTVSNEDTTSAEDKKKAAVAAAIARVKVRRAKLLKKTNN